MRLLLIALVLVFIALPCQAKIYNYKKDGVWVFTDSPPEDKVGESETIEEIGRPAPRSKTGGTQLLQNYPRRSPVEAATAATVAVKGGLGYGSGFFVSTDGYILTNKHVIRTTKHQEKQESQVFNRVDGRIATLQKQFTAEKTRLDSYAADLKQLKSLADRERDSGGSGPTNRNIPIGSKNMKPGRQITISDARNSMPRSGSTAISGQTTGIKSP